MPRFTVLTPVYDTPPAVLEAMLQSVRTQSFEDWEHVLVDDCSPAAQVRERLTRAADQDPRVRIHLREENGGIVAASNDALRLADGDFVALLDHDDALHPDALAIVHEALASSPDCDYLYTDEDKIDEAGHHDAPFFKPDWSPERLRTQMYTCHLSVLRRTLMEEVGGFDEEFEGSQDWDIVLKITEHARQVLHVPRVLYHWRTLATSAAGGGEEAKPWAFEAGTRAVQAHCARVGFMAQVSRDIEAPGVYHLEPRLTDEPLVSIIIPTAGRRREVRYREVVLVEHCIESILATSTYQNLEIVIVVDSHVDAPTRERLAELGGGRVRLVEFERDFNFSAKINRGAVNSEGEYLLLLNDDMEVVTTNWIERMLMYAERPEIGAVGGRLWWQDGRLQHAGILFENGGYPGHVYYGFPGTSGAYSNNILVAQNYLALTGACLMTSRADFEEVGGFSLDFPMNYNDMDFCLKLDGIGRRNVYDPDTILYHFESSSRDTEVEDWEKDKLRERWLARTAIDPSTNPHLRHGMPRLSAPFAWMKRRRLLQLP